MRCRCLLFCPSRASHHCCIAASFRPRNDSLFQAVDTPHSHFFTLTLPETGCQLFVNQIKPARNRAGNNNLTGRECAMTDGWRTGYPIASLHRDFDRRSFLGRTAALAGAGIVAAAAPRRLLAADKPVLVNSIRSLTNPYHATWNQGGAAFAKSVGADYVTLVTEGNSEKGIADIRAVLAKTGGNMVLNVDPNDSPDARPIVEACVKAGAHVVTQWNKPADLHPWDHNPYYVAHISFDGMRYGEATANALIKAIGGSGGIVALGGILSNTPAVERKAGLDKALAANPGVKLLDFQVANWKSSEAFDIVSAWLTRFGKDIKGVWAANDDM